MDPELGGKHAQALHPRRVARVPAATDEDEDEPMPDAKDDEDEEVWLRSVRWFKDRDFDCTL